MSRLCIVHDGRTLAEIEVRPPLKGGLLGRDATERRAVLADGETPDSIAVSRPDGARIASGRKVIDMSAADIAGLVRKGVAVFDGAPSNMAVPKYSPAELAKAAPKESAAPPAGKAPAKKMSKKKTSKKKSSKTA